MINRVRQFWKTTTLNLLVEFLSHKHTAFFISFEGLGESSFETEASFCKTVVLMIDEVNQSSNHKVFLDSIGMLRSKFLMMNIRPTFQSVILAGVYDLKKLRQRIRENCEHQYNSPWNIAAGFCVYCYNAQY